MVLQNPKKHLVYNTKALSVLRISKRIEKTITLSFPPVADWEALFDFAFALLQIRE